MQSSIAILTDELVRKWPSFEGSFEEKVHQMIKMARKHWMVTELSLQQQGVILALGHIHKKEDEEKFELFVFMVKFLKDPVSFMNDPLVKLQRINELQDKYGVVLPSKDWNDWWTE